MISQGRIAAAALDPGNGAIHLDASTLSDLQNPDSFVRILTIDGLSIQDQANTLSQIGADRTAIGRSLIDGRSIPYVTLPIHYSTGKIVAILQTGASREDIEELLSLLTIGLVVAAPAVIIMAVAGGHLFAGRVLPAGGRHRGACRIHE